MTKVDKIASESKDEHLHTPIQRFGLDFSLVSKMPQSLSRSDSYTPTLHSAFAGGSTKPWVDQGPWTSPLLVPRDTRIS